MEETVFAVDKLSLKQIPRMNVCVEGDSSTGRG